MDEEENRHYDEVVHSLRSYKEDMFAEIERRERALMEEPELADLLPGGHEGQLAKFRELRNAVLKSQEFLSRVADKNDSKRQLHEMPPIGTRINNLSKVRSTLHQCAREWSAEGAQERSVTFDPLLEWLQKYMDPKENEIEKETKRVLVPGAGLGRLMSEIVARGYHCEGNEFSFQMLITSNFILNSLESSAPEKQITICPWVHNPSNAVRAEDLFRKVRIPDQSATELIQSTKKGCMSMCAGEFTRCYKDQKETWDAVVTCFFIDTAPNILEYIKVIHKILKPNGIWINAGPLMWHWQASGPTGGVEARVQFHGQDERYAQSIELSYEEVKSACMNYGFDFLEESWAEVGYTQNILSMLSSQYKIARFVARKRISS